MAVPGRLLLFDLDDTLLSSDKTISSANAAALGKCKSSGMHIGYITARSPRKVKTYLADLPCDGIAYYNGASVYIGDVRIEENVIPYDAGIDAMARIQRAHPGVRIGAYLEPYSYFNGEIRHIATNEVTAGDLMDLPRCGIQRIRVVFAADGGFDLQPYLTDDMIHFVSIHGSAVITNKNATKENAMKKIADWFGIPLRDVVAFGDDVNDGNMIRLAGTGVAMGNAVESLKQTADDVADSNDNDGVAKWIAAHLAADG